MIVNDKSFVMTVIQISMQCSITYCSIPPIVTIHEATTPCVTASPIKLPSSSRIINSLVGNIRVIRMIYTSMHAYMIMSQ